MSKQDVHRKIGSKHPVRLVCNKYCSCRSNVCPCWSVLHYGTTNVKHPRAQEHAGRGLRKCRALRRFWRSYLGLLAWRAWWLWRQSLAGGGRSGHDPPPLASPAHKGLWFRRASCPVQGLCGLYHLQSNFTSGTLAYEYGAAPQSYSLIYYMNRCPLACTSCARLCTAPWLKA